jgi:3-hydroxy-9,10-secoandrosta-1,3,5(10)-triene-9,17-dione monooxygenase
MTDRDEMVRRARALRPVLRERARATEEARRIPDETASDFRAAGLTTLAQPSRFGGLGLDLDTVFACGVELGRGDGSAAWVGSQWGLHNWMVGMWPLEGQQEYFGDDPAAVLASTSLDMSGGTVTAAPGGVTLAGRWGLSSGVDLADWVMLFGMGERGPAAHLVPRAEIEVDDTWYAAGLCGSGTNDVVVRDVFVPEHRSLSLPAALTATTPGRELHESVFYRVPLMSFLAFALAAPILGMALGAVELFEDSTRERIDPISGRPARERPHLHRRLADASAALDAARLLLRHDVEEVAGKGRADTGIALADRARWRRDQAWIVRTAVQATDTVFEASGAHALFLSEPLQRHFRDVNAASHTMAVTWDPIFELYGRVRFGLDPDTFDI